MTPQAADFLSAATSKLHKAHANQRMGFPDEAARLAYQAMFHAAQAIIFERTSTFSKTHKGVRALFSKLSKSEPQFDRTMPRDLVNAYRFKQAADYETGTAAAVKPAEAADVIARAEHFVAIIRNVLAPAS